MSGNNNKENSVWFQGVSVLKGGEGEKLEERAGENSILVRNGIRLPIWDKDCQHDFQEGPGDSWERSFLFVGKEG